PGSALHLLGVPRRGDASAAQRRARRRVGAGRRLFPVVSSGRRGVAVLGAAAGARGIPVRARGDQRGGSGPAPGGALQPGVEQRDQGPGRLRLGPARVRPAHVLASAALARGTGRRTRRRVDLITWGPPSGPPMPPALRAPAEPWRFASV